MNLYKLHTKPENLKYYDRLGYHIDEHGNVCFFDGNGNLHRDDDLPALIQPNGVKMWYKHGKRHRDGGKPAVILHDGHKQFWVDGNWVRKAQG